MTFDEINKYKLAGGKISKLPPADQRTWKNENSRRSYHKNIKWERLRQKVRRVFHAEALSEKSKAWRRELKERVIKAYGGKCRCCGDATFEFLTIDHKRGGGRQDRLLSRRSSFYKYLIDHNYPKKDYRLLCMNCNFSLGKYGYCPHSHERNL